MHRPDNPLDPPTAIQALLDDQMRRTSLLTQLAIEFRESLDQSSVIEQTLRAVALNLMATGASIILVRADATPEFAYTTADGLVQPMPAALAAALVNKGLAGWVIRHGSSVALSDVARDRRWLQFSEQHRSGSVIVLPIRQAQATLGALTVHRALPYGFSSQDLILLEGVAAQLSVALSAARQQAYERQRRDQAMTLLQMSQYLSAERSPAELAAMIQEKSVAVFGARCGLLFLLDDRDGQPGLRAVLPAEPLPIDRALVEHAGGAARIAWTGNRILTTAPAPDLTGVALPLVHQGRAIGAFVLIHAGSSGFSATIWSLLTIFTHVLAAACANMALVSHLTAQTRLLEELVAQRTRQLRHSRDALRVVFDSLPEGILLLDTAEHLVAANRIFCADILGRPPQEVVGQSYAAVWQALERRGAARVHFDDSDQPRRQRLTVHLNHADGARMYQVERIALAGEDIGIEQYLEYWRMQNC
jgi:GAF domain-containing protein